MPKFSACIFDLDGTLADTLGSIADIANGALRAFHLPTIEKERYKLMVGNGADKLLSRMLEAVGADLSPQAFKAFRAEYDRRYAADPLGGVTAYPGLVQLLTDLKAAGVKLGVLSNKPDNMTKLIVKALYGDLPDTVQGQTDGVPKKPDPTAVLAMTAKLGVAPEEVLYVGDSGVDMDTAHNAGMLSCGVLWGFRSRQELEDHKAAYIVKDAEKLRALILP